jgi:hypothetical protein
MKSISYWFIGLGSLFALAGMGFGIYMSSSGDHTLAPAHAHNNLIGFVIMVIYGVFYRLVPAAAVTMLARIHFWISLAGSICIGPGIAMAITGQGEWLAVVGSILTIVAMAIFAWTVFTNRAALSA